MHKMIIGVTKDREYKFPISLLANHNFYPGDKVQFLKGNDGELIVKKV